MTLRRLLSLIVLLFHTSFGFDLALDDSVSVAKGGDPQKLFVWPDLAPGETSGAEGVALPPRPTDTLPITRLEGVRRPSLDAFLPDKPNGTAVIVLPGGGFGKIVPDMEGSATAPWLNELGVAVFVLRYRTNEVKPKDEPSWLRPLQDAQRAIRIVRSRADEWKIDKNRVGQLAFSAGGQVGAVLHTGDGSSAYEPIDGVDQQNCLPNFSMLIYPWRIMVSGSDQEPDSLGRLLPEIKPSPQSPPVFIVHTHDDQSSSIGSVLLYAALKRHNVMAELHVYENGGHGYGTRHIDGSNIGSWPDRATDWLVRRELGVSKK